MPLGALGAIGGAVGGAAKGFAPALRDVMERDQRQQQFDTRQADTRAFQQTQLDQGQQRIDQAGAAEANRVAEATTRQGELVRQGQDERARARRRDLADKNYRQQMLEITGMRERRLSEGTSGDERADRALNAAEAVAALQRQRPTFGDTSFDYEDYMLAMDEWKQKELDVWKTFGFDGPEHAAEFMPGGRLLRPSNHRTPGASADVLRENFDAMTNYTDYLRPGGG